jgi:aspartyl-tRNA(Asn)/glutamyl-tRNA(Gln) amidotransferase subunit A
MTQIRSAEEQVGEAFARIAVLNPRLNAFITTFETEAMAQARALDAESRAGQMRPLHGQPVSLKDLLDVKGAQTTAASRSRAGHVAKVDSTVVARLRHAGAVIIGKTNLHELAFGTTNEESAFGPARNPHDPDRSPGGSSGGSAAAVAARMGWASIGSDTGGSIRIPSAACGVVGLKPSFGEVPLTGVVPLSVSLDHVGPIASSVIDAWTLFSVIADAALPQPSGLPVRGVRLGKLGGYFLAKLDTGVRQEFEASVERLSGAGANISDVGLETAPDVPSTYVNVVLPEAYAYHARLLDEVPEQFSEGVRTRLQMGKEISRQDYVTAQSDRSVLRAAVDRALAGCDALVLPTLPIPAPKIGATTVPIGGDQEPLRPLMLRLTQLFNLTGHPAISLPCGSTSEGLPVGLQLVGRLGKTAELLDLAMRCEPHVTPGDARFDKIAL